MTMIEAGAQEISKYGLTVRTRQPVHIHTGAAELEVAQSDRVSLGSRVRPWVVVRDF
jgi:hypothetical protein